LLLENQIDCHQRCLFGSL